MRSEAALRSGAAACPGVSACSGANLARPKDQRAVGRQLLQPDRAAGMNSAGGDANLGAEAEFPTVAELRGRVPQRDRAVHAAEECARRRLVLGNDGVGVVTAVVGDMVQRALDPI